MVLNGEKFLFVSDSAEEMNVKSPSLSHCCFSAVCACCRPPDCKMNDIDIVHKHVYNVPNSHSIVQAIFTYYVHIKMQNNLHEIC